MNLSALCISTLGFVGGVEGKPKHLSEPTYNADARMLNGVRKFKHTILLPCVHAFCGCVALLLPPSRAMGA
jgi:hypothetical protein